MATPIKLNSEDEFYRLLRGLSDDIIDAHIYWGQYQALQDQVEKWPQVYAEGSTFWIYTLHAHRRTALACLCRAFDQEPSSLHLHSWLVTIKNHLDLFGRDKVEQRMPSDPFVKWMKEDAAKPDPQELDDDIKNCSRDNADVAALNNYRGAVLAHRAARLTKLGDPTKLPALFVEQVERLLSLSLLVLNRYSYMFTASHFATKPIGHDHVENIFNSVSEQLAYRDQLLREQVAQLQSSWKTAADEEPSATPSVTPTDRQS